MFSQSLKHLATKRFLYHSTRPIIRQLPPLNRTIDIKSHRLFQTRRVTNRVELEQGNYSQH